jgi:hypothetical protein
VSGKRPLRPFPALDPEPPRRITWHSLRWPAVACAAAAAAAAALLTWPSPSSSPSAPARALFADRDGLVVFEQQPSGLLGTAAPDGSHRVMLTRLGTLQGTDLPVASADDRLLVNTEGQLVRMGPAGPASVSSLPVPAQGSGSQWANASFADGSRYVVATACYPTSVMSQSWVADLIPVASGRERRLGTATGSAGDPQSAGALASAPASPSGATSIDACYSMQTGPDKAVELRRPGQAPRTIATVAQLTGALGWPPRTPVLLRAVPAPGGGRLAVQVEAMTTAGSPVRQGLVVVTYAGATVAGRQLSSSIGAAQWSPDGRQLAFCQAAGNVASSVTTWTPGRAARTIVLPGHHDIQCTQLLWSPGGTQLIYAAESTRKGLTQADNLQHGWTVIDLRSGRVHDVTAPGQPAAWVPAAGVNR